MEISLGFMPLLRDFDVEHLEAHPGCVYGLWPDFRLAFMNRAWNEFQAANGGLGAGWTLGADAMQAIPPVLRAFYRERFAQVLRELRPWEHVYECSSPAALRQFHMVVYPLQARQGLLAIHSLQYEAPRNCSANQASDYYADAEGAIHQCSHCRRVRVPGDERRWDWAASLVRTSHPRAKHTLCPPCRGFYYGHDGSGRGFPQPVTTMEPPSFVAQWVLRNLLASPAASRDEIARQFLSNPREAFYSGFDGRAVE